MALKTLVLICTALLLLLALAACQPPFAAGGQAPTPTSAAAGAQAITGHTTTVTPASPVLTAQAEEDARGKKKRTTSPPPQGPLVAYVREGRIWVDGGARGAWPVTAGDSDDTPLFSPDGRWILFRRALPQQDDDPRVWELWMARADGSEERPVAGRHNLPGTDIHRQVPVNPVWSPDSASIAFETHLACDLCGSGEDLWIYSLESGQVRSLLFDEEGGAFAYSPDGQRLVVSSRTELYVVDVNGRNHRTLLVYEPIVYLDGFHYPLAVWTEDGQAILTAVPPKDQMQLLMGQAPPGVEARTSLWRLWLDGEAELVAQLSRANSGSWSPDHALYAYTEIGTARLVIISTTTGAVAYESAGLFQNWSPDSHHFTYLPDLPGKTFWLSEMALGCITNNTRPLVPAREASGLRPVTWVDGEHFIYLAKTGPGVDDEGFEIRLKQVDGDYRLIYASSDRAASMEYSVFSP